MEITSQEIVSLFKAIEGYFNTSEVTIRSPGAADCSNRVLSAVTPARLNVLRDKTQ